LVEGGRKQQAAALTMDSVVKTFGGAAKINKDASTAFKNAVDVFADTVGAKKVAGGNVQSGGSSAARFAGPTPGTTAQKQAMNQISAQSAKNEVASGRVGKEEAKAILENGSPKDIAAFGGREALEKVAGAPATAPATAPTTASKQKPGLGSAPGRTAPAPVPTSTSQLKDAGLVIKKGDVQKEGAEVDPRLIEIAKQIQSQVPGFTQFTGFNDQFHNERSPKSKHTKGKAFDFTVNKKPTPEEGKKILEIMRSLGIDYAIDEYNNPSSKATAGHFHGELSARLGGTFDGSTSGYPVMLHGKETVLNKSQTDKLNKKIENVEQNPVESMVPALKSSSVSSAPNNDMVALLQQMSEMMEDKLDTMIGALEDGNNTSDKILTYSMA
jgi:hypothetical protein